MEWLRSLVANTTKYMLLLFPCFHTYIKLFILLQLFSFSMNQFDVLFQVNLYLFIGFAFQLVLVYNYQYRKFHLGLLQVVKRVKFERSFHLIIAPILHLQIPTQNALYNVNYFQISDTIFCRFYALLHCISSKAEYLTSIF